MISSDRTITSSAQANLNQSVTRMPRPVPRSTEYRPPARLHPDPDARSIVDYSPSEIVRRHSAAWTGLLVETVPVMRHTPFEYGFRAPHHLLIAAELGERYGGETFVEGLPRSTLRDFTHKLTFVPAGHDFRGSQRPRTLTRITYFYIDPRGGLSPIPRSGSVRSSSGRACSFTIGISGRLLSSSSHRSRTRARCPGNMRKRSPLC
jgi:AraC family transcriptional regulator